MQQETNSNTESKIEKDSYTEKQVIHIIPSIQITTTEGETEMFEDKDLQIDLLPEMSDSNVLEDVPGFERYSNEIAAPPNSPIIKKISHDASPQEITVDINESIVSYPELIMKDEPSNQVQKCIITQKIKVADPLDWRLVLTYPPAVAGYFACFAATYGWQTFGINQPLFMRDLYGFHIEQVHQLYLYLFTKYLVLLKPTKVIFVLCRNLFFIVNYSSYLSAAIVRIYNILCKVRRKNNI